MLWETDLAASMSITISFIAMTIFAVPLYGNGVIILSYWAKKTERNAMATAEILENSLMMEISAWMALSIPTEAPTLGFWN